MSINSETYSSCAGCYPIYQQNQLAHMDEGGCLWCDYSQENESLHINGELDILFEESKSVEITESVSSDNTECCICYEIIDKNKNNCTTECGHKFCLKCLMTSFAHNNADCPCCRQELVDIPDESDSDSDSGSDSETESDNETDIEYDGCQVDELTRRLLSNGITMENILSMLIGRYNRNISMSDIAIITDKFDQIIFDADKEQDENMEMGEEDKNCLN